MSTKRYRRECAYCGWEFTAKSAKGKFCSAKCRLDFFKKKKNTSFKEVMYRLIKVRDELDSPTLHKSCPTCKEKKVPFTCSECTRPVTKCYDAFERNGKKICLWCWCNPQKNIIPKMNDELKPKGKIQKYLEEGKKIKRG
jgi:hypothetical protein